jgi:hypothetical protein
VERAGIDVNRVLAEEPDLLPRVARTLGGGSLVPQIVAVAPKLLSDPDAHCLGGPMFRKMVPVTSPTLSALMALAQMVQRKHPQATTEWKRLTHLAKSTPDLGSAMLTATNQLAAAQAAKAAA